jgi:hypothetical protein
MRDRFGWSSAGAGASVMTLLAVLIVNGVRAGEVVLSPNHDDAARPNACDPSGEACARISGYIKAGSDSPSGDASGPHVGAFPAPRLAAGADSSAPAQAAAASRDTFFLEVSHDDRIR